MNALNQPMGRLLSLSFRQMSFYTDDGGVGSMDVLRIHFCAPDGDVYHHDLPNTDYHLGNEALQFLAKWQYQPTDWAEDETRLDVEDEQVLIPVAMTPDGVYGLGQQAMSGARDALANAEWFAPSNDEEADSDPHSGPGGGGDSDPGTGNRGGVEEQSEPEVTAELAEEDSDQGVTVTVE